MNMVIGPTQPVKAFELVPLGRKGLTKYAELIQRARQLKMGEGFTVTGTFMSAMRSGLSRAGLAAEGIRIRTLGDGSGVVIVRVEDPA